MRSSKNRFSPFSISLFAGTLLFLAPSAARAQSCAVVYNAVDKLATTTHRSHLVVTAADGKQSTRTTVTANNVTYIQMRDGWSTSKVSPAEALKQEQANRQKANNVSCQAGHQELIDGVYSQIYNAHSELNGVKTDAQVWIAKDTGLITREDQNTVNAAGRKMHSSTQYEYKNVVAPIPGRAVDMFPEPTH